MGMNLKTGGIRYEYNNVTIQIPVSMMGASQIGITGVKIGSAKDYDRILSQYPGNIKIRDDVDEFYCNFSMPTGVSSNKITLHDDRHTAFLTKSDDDLMYTFEQCQLTKGRGNSPLQLQKEVYMNIIQGLGVVVILGWIMFELIDLIKYLIKHHKLQLTKEVR